GRRRCRACGSCRRIRTREESPPRFRQDAYMRPVGLGIKAFLIVAAPLAFAGGCQVALLSAHTETYWAWTIALPITAIFIGASFLATSVLFAWGLQQREWIRVRAVVSGGPFVTLGLLVATL